MFLRPLGEGDRTLEGLEHHASTNQDMNLPERLPAGSGLRAAARMADIEPFHVMQIIARAKQLEAQGRRIVNMVVGEPDFPIAPLVRDAGIRVLEAGRLHYTPALGITPLREAISGWYRERYRAAVPAARIAVTTGSSGALLLTMGVLLVGVGVALSDVMQYTIGKLLGKHIISPAVNPRKAWEGLLGDFLGAGLAVFLFRFALPAQFTWLHWVALTLVIGLGAAWGDLISSLVKRVAGAKDWGGLVPGHGGLLDRANSLVVVIPLVYYFTYAVLMLKL